MKNRDALTPAPTPGAVLAAYTTEMLHEERLGLRKVERVTPGGQIVLASPYAGRYDASGREIGGGSARCYLRWPTAEDLVEHRRLALTKALCTHRWGSETDEVREQVAALLKIEVKP